MAEDRAQTAGRWRHAAAASRRNGRLRVAGYVIAGALILVGLLDVISTNLGLAQGGVEINPLVRLIQDGLGAWWFAPKMSLHFITAAMVLWFPRVDVLLAVAAVASLVALVTWHNFVIAGLI